jgi:hypothetical protein
MFFRECFVKSASGSVFGLGYIWILLDEKNRGWHDKILDSYVVDLKESERMNLRRHLEKARAEAQKNDSAPMPAAAQLPAPEPVTDAKEAELLIPEENQAEESVIEVIPEVVIQETEGSAADEESGEPYVEIAEDAGREKPELSMSMKKEELLEAARERGVQVSARATKAAIIEAIEKAENETDK